MHDAPRRRSLESLKKEAKRWHADLDTSDAARERLRRITPDASAAPTLREVQHAVAIELGESGWTALKSQLIAAGDAANETLRRRDGITAYCRPENKVALGLVAGLNNKIRVIQRRCYGLRDEDCLHLKILTCPLPPLPRTSMPSN